MPKVLVVDDSPVDLRLVTRLLQKESSLSVECANNGSDALAHLSRSLPELILTDMQMPDMNGLELVTTARLQYPDIPVVLMTAHGSEYLAVEALEQGAASYVPKSQLAEKLLTTVIDVLNCTQADQTYEKLIGCLTRTQFHYQLDNDDALISPLVGMVQQMVAGIGLCDFNSKVRLGVALREALLNAMYHGNLELGIQRGQEAGETLPMEDSEKDRVRRRQADPRFSGRKVCVEFEVDHDQAVFVIRDEGPGFDVNTVPDPEDPESLQPQSGRGLWLIKSFMDEVRFNQTGNEITMVKRR